MTDLTLKRIREIEEWKASKQRSRDSERTFTAEQSTLPTTSEKTYVKTHLLDEKKFRECLPSEMLTAKRWVKYFLKPKPDGTGTAKIPLGNHSEPSTWSTFDDVVKTIDNDQQGIGFNFLHGEIHGLDIDHCRNPKTGKICNEAMVLLSRLPSWAEFSVSGQGIHLLFKGNVRGKQLGETCLQYWNPKNSPRFFAITCDMVGEAFTNLKDVGDEFNYIFSTARHISAKIREELKQIDYEQWAALPAEREEVEEKTKQKPKTKSRKLHKDFNPEDFLKFYGLEVDNVTTNNIGKCYRLTTCPIKGEPHVGQNSTTTNFILSNDGGLAFHCQSTGCVDWSVAQVIQKLAEDKGPYPGKIYVEEKTSFDYFSDGDLAKEFVRSQPALKFAIDERIWFGYRNGVWQARDNAKPEIESFLRSIEPNDITDLKLMNAIHRRLTSTRACHAVSFFAEAKPQLSITVAEFDPDPMLLGLPDGEVLDLRTGTRRAATPSDLITRTLPVAPGGRSERWLQYLEQAHPNDPELIAYLQRWAGYCLTASVKEDMILFLIGVGGSGKGTFAEPLQKLLGDYCVSIPIGMLLEDTAEDRRLNYIASLRGARLAICNEGSKMRRLDSRGIKLLTGGGWITGRRLGHQPINFKQTHKLCVLANDNPVLELDDAMRQRVHVVPFNQKFRDTQKEEKGLREFFTEPEQLKGIFNWVLEGCLAYQKQGLNPPASVTSTTEQFFEDMDTFERFKKDHLMVEEKTRTHFQPTQPMFQRWKSHCIEEGDEHAIGTMRTFAATLKAKCSHLKGDKHRVAGREVRGFWGLKLLPEAQQEFDELTTDSRAEVIQ